AGAGREDGEHADAGEDAARGFEGGLRDGLGGSRREGRGRVRVGALERHSVIEDAGDDADDARRLKDAIADKQAARGPRLLAGGRLATTARGTGASRAAPPATSCRTRTRAVITDPTYAAPSKPDPATMSRVLTSSWRPQPAGVSSSGQFPTSHVRGPTGGTNN